MLKLPLKKVLIVDDDPIQRELLESYLIERGVNDVLMATNGEEAKRRLAAEGSAIDLIVSDINMPEMDGVEFLMHISSSGTKTALVFVSGAISPVIAGVEALAKRLPVNFLGLIKKPTCAEKLDEVISKLPQIEAA